MAIGVLMKTSKMRGKSLPGVRVIGRSKIDIVEQSYGEPPVLHAWEWKNAVNATNKPACMEYLCV